MNEKDKQNHPITWHQKHKEKETRGEHIADAVVAYMGSWKFIILQSLIVLLWIGLNLFGYFSHWDPYPFILLNLIFSTQAAYAAPIIMMSQNRQSQRDREQALEDYTTNIEAKKEIEKLQLDLSRIENDKLKKIIVALKDLQARQK